MGKKDKLKLIDKYIKKYQKKLDLEDFKIDIVTGYIKDDYMADVRRVGGNHYSIVFDLNSPNLKDTVLHELLHIFFWQLMAKEEAILNLCDWGGDVKNRVADELEEIEHILIDILVKHLK